MNWLRTAWVWGSFELERSRSYPCDEFASSAKTALFRAVTIHAPASTVFLWLCQLRIAPYSYDWIDNGGKRSPRSLTPGLDRLEVGQRVMTIFRLLSFEKDRHLTVELTSDKSRRWFGDLVITYWLDNISDNTTRMVVKIASRGSRPISGLLAWGDLVMMRKQLLTLKSLAESTSV